MLNVNGVISAVSFPWYGNLCCPIKPLKLCPADSVALNNKQEYWNGYYYGHLSSRIAYKVIKKWTPVKSPKRKQYVCIHVQLGWWNAPAAHAFLIGYSPTWAVLFPHLSLLAIPVDRPFTPSHRCFVSLIIGTLLSGHDSFTVMQHYTRKNILPIIEVDTFQ